mgnify:CR=1 FL=1
MTFFYIFLLRDHLGLATRDINVYIDCKLLVLELISETTSKIENLPNRHNAH